MTIDILTLIFLILASLADGIVEGYEFDQRKSFERKYGSAALSFFGSESWRRAYKNNDPTQGYKNLYTKFLGAFDLYHILDDLRKFGYILAGAFIVIFNNNNTWITIIFNCIVYLSVAAFCKSSGMRWVRN